MDPALADMSVAEMDYKGAFSMGKISKSMKTEDYCHHYVFLYSLFDIMQVKRFMVEYCGILTRT